MDTGIEVKVEPYDAMAHTSVCAGVGGRERRNIFTCFDNHAAWWRQRQVRELVPPPPAARARGEAPTQVRGASTSGKPGRCEHNLQMSLCKECGGACICQHNREKSRCKECRGGSVCHSTIGTGAIARRAKQRKTTRCRQISRSSKIDPCSLLPRHKSILVPRLFLIGLHASPKAWQQAKMCLLKLALLEILPRSMNPERVGESFPAWLIISPSR